MTRHVPNLYVYYRVKASHEGEALGAVVRFLALLHQAGTARPRLMRRPEADSAGRQTWMEVYEPWDDTWGDTVDRCFAESGMKSLVDGERHLEVFVDLPLSGTIA